MTINIISNMNPFKYIYPTMKFEHLLYWLLLIGMVFNLVYVFYVLEIWKIVPHAVNDIINPPTNLTVTCMTNCVNKGYEYFGYNEEKFIDECWCWTNRTAYIIGNVWQKNESR